MENISVRMMRCALTTLPELILPRGFRIRSYRPGDRATWVDTYCAAEQWLTITPETFDREFHGDEESLARRMLFICDADGTVIGTSTAWYDDKTNHPDLGRVHWVAVRKAYQGRGLAKPLVAATLHRLAELGHKRAYLYTSSQRLPAITLYLKFGFVPELLEARDEEGWRDVLVNIRPEFRTTIESSLAASVIA